MAEVQGRAGQALAPLYPDSSQVGSPWIVLIPLHCFAPGAFLSAGVYMCLHCSQLNDKD